MFIRTERLFLRPPFPEDWPAIHRGLADAGVVRMLARAPWPYVERDAQAWCARPDDPGEIRFLVTVPTEPGAPVIGCVSLRPEAGAMELGYWIAASHAGQGYATEAVLGAIEVARAIGVGRIEAAHFVDNPASARVLRKAGFIPTGEARPVFCCGRGGEMVLSRRHALNLLQPAGNSAGAQAAA